MQLHSALVSRTTQLEKGPHGLGEQGSTWLVAGKLQAMEDIEKDRGIPQTVANLLRTQVHPFPRWSIGSASSGVALNYQLPHSVIFFFERFDEHSTFSPDPASLNGLDSQTAVDS